MTRQLVQRWIINTIAAVIVLGLLVERAAACLWDEDTLRIEAAGLPDVADAATGFFERLPEPYFERRLEIAVERVASDPSDFDAYDNAAVALDRLKGPDEAEAWLDRKRAALEGAGLLGVDDEHEYRYHANLGTVLVHRWLVADEAARDPGDLDGAYEHIARAIEINPDAHFGRERYQLAAIEWLRAGAPSKRFPDRPMGNLSIAPGLLGFVRDEQGAFVDWYDRPAEQLADAIEGVTGLIVLGAAWESVDVFAALTYLLDVSDNAFLAVLTRARVRELLAAGRSSRSSEIGDSFTELQHVYQGFGAQVYDGQAAAVDRYFHEARAAADEWHAEHSTWVLGKLGRSEHPNTHADFWTGAPAATIPMPPSTSIFEKYGLWLVNALLALLAVGLTVEVLRRLTLMVVRARRTA